MRIPTPAGDIVIVKELFGYMSRNFRAWVQQVSDLSTIQGDGSPEGVQSARATRFYMDDLTGDLYIKSVDSIAGNDKNGWKAV